MVSLKLGNHIEDPRGAGCLDRISSLPDELRTVLSFLPTRSAVRTSIVSTRWRYIFTLTSCLSFDDEPWFRGPSACSQIYKARKKALLSFGEGLFEIDAPNLAYLSYNCNIGIKIKFLYGLEHSLGYDREIFKAAACKITELRLLANLVKNLLILGDQEQMPDFHSLSRLHLSYIPFDSWKYVKSLLDKSPQLEMVIFERGLHRCFCDPASPPCEPLFPFSCHAQVIEVCCLCGHKGSILHLGNLLKNARLLKKLIIHKCRSETLEGELQISKDDLLILPRASSGCCIELN